MSATARQLWLPALPDNAVEHGEILHPSSGAGFVTLAYIREGKFKHKAHVPPSDLAYFLKDEFNGNVDCYISQNRFRYKRRRVATLLETDALFSDEDYYKVPGLEYAHPHYVWDLMLEKLQREGIPEPSLGISSGRGIQPIWLHTPLDARHVARWNQCQERICEALQEFGADRMARHAATVLRLVGSIHGKTGNRVECFAGSGNTWDFEDLAYEIEPIRKKEPRHTKKTASLYVKAAKAGRRFGPRAWNGASLWATRFDELRIIREHRWPEGIPEGSRDKWLFLAAVAFTWIGHPTRLDPEISELARQCGGTWTEADTRTAYSAALARAIKAAKGETVSWGGLDLDPRYRMKSSTIVEWLGLDESEMRAYGLRNLVSEDHRREQKAIACRLRRASRDRGNIQSDTCATDYKTRDRYEAESKEATRPWDALGISRRTYYRRQAAEAYASLGEDVTDCVGVVAL